MNRAIAWFARNHVAANLLMAFMVIGGLVSLPNIQQRTFPDIQVDVIAGNVIYLGAAAEEVVKPDQLIWMIIGDREQIEEPIRALNIGEVEVRSLDDAE